MAMGVTQKHGLITFVSVIYFSFMNLNLYFSYMDFKSCFVFFLYEYHQQVMSNPSDKVRSPSLAVRIGIVLGVVRNPALSPNCIVPKTFNFFHPKTSTGKL